MMRKQTGKAGRTRGRRLITSAFVVAFVAGGLFVTAGQAAAQGSGSAASDEGRRQRPPIRASATVEVIDPARGVDEIISRVRDQKNRRADSAKERTKEESSRSDDDDKGRRGANAGGADRDRDPPPADKNDRPSYRPDRDRRDPRRQDGEARPSLPRDRRQSNTRH
jgi:hypothetical protein